MFWSRLVSSRLVWSDTPLRSSVRGFVCNPHACLTPPSTQYPTACARPCHFRLPAGVHVCRCCVSLRWLTECVPHASATGAPMASLQHACRCSCPTAKCNVCLRQCHCLACHYLPLDPHMYVPCCMPMVPCCRARTACPPERSAHALLAVPPA